jgi:hypothetical protein
VIRCKSPPSLRSFYLFYRLKITIDDKWIRYLLVKFSIIYCSKKLRNTITPPLIPAKGLVKREIEQYKIAKTNPISINPKCPIEQLHKLLKLGHDEKFFMIIKKRIA